MDRLFYPTDQKQALRTKRVYMALGSYVMCCFLISISVLQGWSWFTVGDVMLLGLVVLMGNLTVLVMIRTGFNLRFKDPSLTMGQMAFAIPLTAVIAYYSDQVRSLMLLFYYLPFIFGVFRLRLKQFLILAAAALASYGIVIVCLLIYRPESTDLPLEFMRWLVLGAALPWLSLLGGHISRLRRRIEAMNAELSKAVMTIENLAIRDDLTKVYNRRHLMAVLDQEKAQTERGLPPFSLAIFDLDHFKTVNDTFGHLAGDDVLKDVVHRVESEIREVDSIARYGGEEFVIVLKHTPLAAAVTVSERMREVIETLPFPYLFENHVVTISIGVTEHKPGESLDATLARADRALYLAKEKGRNRVESEAPPEI